MNKTESAKYSRKYYKKNPKYREKKIEQRKAYAKEHRDEQREYAKDYYWKNPKYRSYKIKYAKDYRKSHK